MMEAVHTERKRKIAEIFLVEAVSTNGSINHASLSSAANYPYSQIGRVGLLNK